MPKVRTSAEKLHKCLLFSGAIDAKNRHLFVSDGFI